MNVKLNFEFFARIMKIINQYDYVYYLNLQF